MIKKNLNNKVNNIQMISVDELVPQDHLVRKIDKTLDFDFIYELVEDLYSDIGRKSIDPVELFKIVFIQFLFNIKSMRRTIKEIETNLAYRWLLGYDFYSKVPHHSTFSKNYVRRFEGTDVFKNIFEHILTEVVSGGLVKMDNIFIDSTHVKASANKHKVDKEMVKVSYDKYTLNYHKEINELRVKEGNKEIKFPLEKRTHVSRTDSECGMFHKGEKERQLAYSNQVACDENGWVVGSKIVPGNLNDNRGGIEFVSEIASREDVTTTVMDAGYTSPILINAVIESGAVPITPYTRPKGRKTKLEIKKQHFEFKEEANNYVCPNGKILEYKGISKGGYQQYRSKTQDCKKCPLKTNCTNQNNKIITRHLLEYTRKYIREIRLSDLGKALYPMRKYTIERVFAQCKREHGLGFTQVRGIEKNENRSLIIFAMHNLKKLALLATRYDEEANMFIKLMRKILFFLSEIMRQTKRTYSLIN